MLWRWQTSLAFEAGRRQWAQELPSQAQLRHSITFYLCIELSACYFHTLLSSVLACSRRSPPLLHWPFPLRSLVHTFTCFQSPCFWIKTSLNACPVNLIWILLFDDCFLITLSLNSCPALATTFSAMRSLLWYLTIGLLATTMMP